MQTRAIVKRAGSDAFTGTAVCARCGAPDARAVEVTLPYTGSSALGRAKGHIHAHAVGAVILFVLALYALVRGLLMTQPVTLWLPLCDWHAQMARRRTGRLQFGFSMLGTLAAILVVVAVIGLAQPIQPWALKKDEWLILCFAPAGLCAFGALLLRARLQDGFIYVLRVTDEEIEVGGVARGFAQAASGLPNLQVRLGENPAPERIRPGRRRLKALATASLVASLGLFCLVVTSLPVMDTKQPPPLALVWMASLTIVLLGFMPLPLALWGLAYRELVQMRGRPNTPNENSATEVACLQGRFAAVLAFISFALAGAMALIAALR